MRMAYPALFHGIIQSPQNTKYGVVLSGEGCNIPNFGPSIYRHELINHDDYYDVLLYIGSKAPLHMNMMISFCILGVTQLLMIHMDIYDASVGHGP